MVERLAGMLVPHRDIARRIVPAIAVKTLRRHFRAKPDRAKATTPVWLRMLMMREAERRSVTAITY
jgi:hypothetical protein